MSDPNLTQVSAHPMGPIPGIQAISLGKAPQSHLCEMALHIGVFFDGTGNNQDWVEEGTSGTQLQRHKDSNVARLFRAYPDEPAEGYFRAYIPGVGTPFEKIGEEEPESLGAAFGAGGDGRINFALLHVLNSLHRSVSPNGRRYANDAAVKALCRNGRRGQVRGRSGMVERSALSGPEDDAALRSVNMDATGGLLMSTFGDAPQRSQFLRRVSADIKAKMAANPKPHILEIFIDVYGFSRGAAEARAFCNWLLELFEGEQLCGVPAKIRFLGLFDTVASVGMSAATGVANGHLSWADPKYLRIPSQVKNCVHFVAMHENRASFPVELVRQDGVLPSRCQEFMLPGMHSDVGGGYAPGEQGRDPHGKDDEKLSQLPLESMYKASLAAKVPLDAGLARVGGYDPFKVSDSTRERYNAFMTPRQGERLIRDWLFEYIAWRYQTRHNYGKLPWHGRANRDDRDDLMGATTELILDVDALEITSQAGGKPALFGDLQSTQDQMAASRVHSLAKEARTIYAQVKSHPVVGDAAALLFSEHCHDSFAGFRPYDKVKWWGVDPIPGSWEPEGYLRWRRRYEGSNRQLVRRDDRTQQQTHFASNRLVGDEASKSGARG